MKTSAKVAIIAAIPLATAVALPTALIVTANKNVSEVHVLSINDFHGAAPGYGDLDFKITGKANAGAIRLADETQKIIEKHPGSILIAAGDLNAGESFSTVSQAKTFYPVLKAMDIKFSAVGNHAWEWGWTDEQFEEYAALAKPADTEGKYFITSNVLTSNKYNDKQWCIDYTSPAFLDDYTIWKENQLPWADQYKVVDLNGHKVCFIGLTTKDTLKDGNLTSVSKLSFIDYNASVCYSKVKLFEDLYDAGKADEYEKIDAFILDTHCECGPIATGGMKGETIDLAKNLTTKVDAIISAHSHNSCAGYVKNSIYGNNIAIGQAGQSGRAFLDLTIKFNDNNVAGRRLKSIGVEVKKPYIPYGPGGFDKPDVKVAESQLKELREKATSPIVKETIKVYDEQKAIALTALQQPVGTIDGNLNYYYTERTDKGSSGTQYMQSDTLLEKAGVWANKAQLFEFNKIYDDYWRNQKLFYPASIAITNLDSLKTGFTLGEGETTHTVIKNDIFAMHPYENPIHYGTLTVDQLEQYIDYILEGACKFDYSDKPGYDQKLYLDAEHKEEVVWDKTETVNKDKELGTSYVPGLSQFYGFAFEVQTDPKPEERVWTNPETQEKITFKVYKYKKGSLKIYNPWDNTNNIDDPATWTKGSEWTANNGLIPFVIASFTWQGGNAQNRMIHHWADYNSKNDPKAAHQMFSKTTRDLALLCADELTASGKQLNYSITDELVGKLLKLK